MITRYITLALVWLALTACTITPSPTPPDPTGLRDALHSSVTTAVQVALMQYEALRPTVASVAQTAATMTNGQPISPTQLLPVLQQAIEQSHIETSTAWVIQAVGGAVTTAVQLVMVAQHVDVRIQGGLLSETFQWIADAAKTLPQQAVLQ